MSLDPEKYWVGLYNRDDLYDWEDLKPGQRKAKANKFNRIPELVLMFHSWEGVATSNATVTLSLYECDTQEQDRNDSASAKDVLFAKMSLTLKRNRRFKAGKDDDELAERVVASVARGDDMLDDSLKPYKVKRQRNADFVLRIGKQRFNFKIPKDDLAQEARDGVAEIGFVVEESEDVSYEVMPPMTPTHVAIRDRVNKMLGLRQRFSDPARNPSLTTQRAPTQLQSVTLGLLEEEREKKTRDEDYEVNLDIDGLRFDLFLDDSTTVAQFIESLIESGKKKPNGDPGNTRSMLGKTTELFNDMTYDRPKKKGGPGLQAGNKFKSRDVVKLDWTGKTGDFSKAYFVIHDIGIPIDRARRHYKPQNADFRWSKYKSGGWKDKRDITGYVNWGGVYSPSHSFDDGKDATVGIKAPYDQYSLAFECVPIMLYRTAPADDLLRRLGDPSGEDDTYPKAMFQTRDHAGVKFACMGWKHPLGRKHSKLMKRAKKLTTAKDGDAHYLVSAWSQPLIETLADLYLLGSARAGHLLTITCHVEAEREGMGKHSDPNGLVLEALYDAITDRLNGGPFHERDRKLQRLPMTGAEKEARTAYAKKMHSGGNAYKNYVDKSNKDGGKDAQGKDLGEELTPHFLRRPLPGLGALKIPRGVRYGMHPRRLTDAPVNWFGVPFARIYNLKSTHKRTFPHQSDPTGGLPKRRQRIKATKGKKRKRGKKRKKGKK